MKKVILIALILGIGLLFCRFEVRAEELDTYPLGKNYLDLSNLLMKTGDSGCAYTENPILVKPFHQYTIVLDCEFLGQHTNWLGDIYVGIEEYPTHESYDLLIFGDQLNERAYVEFTPTEDYIHITNLPMLPTSYDAILYEGLYADFSGFEPYIDANEEMEYHGVLPIDYDESMTVEQIQSYIHAEDPYGNPLSISIESDNYSTGTKVPGSYQMVFMTNYNQIAKKYYLEVRVFDQTAPLILDPGVISIPLSEKVSLNDIKQMISVSDNVDLISSSDLIVIEDTYSLANSVGSYAITVQAIDSSLNVSTLEIQILLVDLNGPTITGPSAIYLYTSDTPLTNQQIQDYFTFVDDVDGSNVTVQFISDAYHQNQLPGVYDMTVKASDSQLNYKLMNFKIHVIENKGPIFSSDEIILSVAAAESMTEQDLIDWFVTHTLSLGYSISNVHIIFNEYENHENEDGNYYVYLNYEVDGTTHLSRVRIDVINEENPTNFIPYFAIGIPTIIGISALFVIKRKK